MANPDGSREFFNQYRIFNVGAFFRLVNSGIPQMFQWVRFGFVETASTWIPWVIYELRRRLDRAGSRLSDNLMQESHIYCTCQVGDDVPYIIKYAGENTLMIGTDYGHSDSSTELDAMVNLQREGGISDEQFHKIINTNPRVFYGLPASPE